MTDKLSHNLRKPMKQKTKKNPREFTIRDIAALAGVSHTTVSLVLNDSSEVGEDTKVRIRALMDSHGFMPNQSARNLKRRSSETILLVLPELGKIATEAYFLDAITGILDRSTANGFHLMIDIATDAFKSEKRALSIFRRRLIDGALCLGMRSDAGFPSELAAAGCPMVLINSSLAGLSQVVGLNAIAAAEAVVYLHSLGHKLIGHIRGPQIVSASADRTAGYKDGLKQCGLPYDDTLVAQGHFDEWSGYEAMMALLERRPRPTAVFCTNDMMAIGAMQAIHRSKLKVPNDISIFGADDIPLDRYVKPKLSTFRQPMKFIGSTACDLLLEYIKTGNAGHRKIEVPLPLVVRDSCSPPPKRAPKRK